VAGGRNADRRLVGAGRVAADGVARRRDPHADRRSPRAERSPQPTRMTLTATRSDAKVARDTKVALPFDEIASRLAGLTLPDVDVVYGIATGGVVPASLVAYRLGKPL